MREEGTIQCMLGKPTAIVSGDSRADMSDVARLPFLDGLRGLSAAYITVFHAFQIGGIVQMSDRLGPSLLDRVIKGLYYVGFSYGYYAVTVFIVLSGYSLMLPVARSRGYQLVGGFREYFRRRARRILPPYYAALVLSLGLIAVVPGMDWQGDYWWSSAMPAFDSGAIISHVLLVHNWSPDWIGRINTPMWSVAVEWQIYALLPFVLLPVLRRFGLVPMLLVGLSIGLLPQLLFGQSSLSERYIALFALGCFGACISFSHDERIANLRDKVPWAIIGFLAFAGFALLMVAAFRVWQTSAIFHWFYVDRYSLRGLKDLLVGISTLTLIITYARREIEPPDGPAPLGLSLMRSEWSTQLGRFSYSLYLTHAPILTLVALLCLHVHLSATASYVIIVLLGTPVAMLFAWAFSLAFERPFLNKKAKPMT